MINFNLVTCEDCDENAICENGSCKCKDDYRGDGASCEKGKYIIVRKSVIGYSRFS